MSIKKIGKINLPIAQKRLINLYPDLLDEIAQNTKTHFRLGFEQGGGQTDAGYWQPRKKQQGNEGKNILVQSGDLVADIDVREISTSRIVVGTQDIPYANIHNEGGRVPDRYPKNKKALAFTTSSGVPVVVKKAKGFDMEQREFIGESKELTKSNKQIIVDYLNEVFKG